MIRAYLAIALLIALIGSHWYAYSAGVGREHDRNVAAESAQKDATAVKVDTQAQASSDARTTMLDYLAEQKPAIEIRTHDTITKIRKIYVDSPMPAVCIRHVGVQSSLDAARDSANKAIGRM